MARMHAVTLILPILVRADLQHGVSISAQQAAEIAKFEVVDIGASNGGSIDAISHVTGVPPSGIVGLDISRSKVERCVSGGRNCLEVDVATLANEIHEPLVSGVTLFHVLEHINRVAKVDRTDPVRLDAGLASSVLVSAAKIAKDFVYFRGPNFDNQPALYAQNFIRYYETWRGHSCHFNSTDLARAFSTAAAARDAEWIIFAGYPIYDSDHSYILRIDAPENQYHYGHPKNELTYDKPSPPVKMNAKLYGSMLGVLSYTTSQDSDMGSKLSQKVFKNALSLAVRRGHAEVLACSPGWKACDHFRNQIAHTVMLQPRQPV